MRFLTVMLVSLVAAASAATPASADTLQMQTPWVAVYEPGVPDDECRSYLFHCTESATGDWEATCPDGYAFALAPGAETTGFYTIPDPVTGAPIQIFHPYWWYGAMLSIHISYSASAPPTEADPDGVAVPSYPHLWGEPQDYLCTSGAATRAATSAASKSPVVARASGLSVRHVVRTVPVPKTGRPVAARLACPQGGRLFRSGSTMATFRETRPSKRDRRQLDLQHRERPRSAAITATATSKLDGGHRVKAQLWVDCVLPGA